MNPPGKLSEAGQADLVRLAAQGATPCPLCLTQFGMARPGRPDDGLCITHRIVTRYYHRITSPTTH